MADDPYLVDNTDVSNTSDDPYIVNDAVGDRPQPQAYGLPAWDNDKSFLQNARGMIMSAPLKPGGPPIIPSIMNMFQGVPVAGAAMPETKELKELHKNYPNQSTVGRMAATGAVLGPLAGRTSEALGGGFWRTLLGEGNTFGAINATDTAARGGDKWDSLKSYGTGFLSGLIPQALNKGISPNAGAPVRVQLRNPAGQPGGGQFTGHFRMRPDPMLGFLIRRRTEPPIRDIMSRGMGGAIGAVGGSLVGAPIMGGILGAMRPELRNMPPVPQLSRYISGYLGNQVMATPGNQSLLAGGILGPLLSSPTPSDEPQGIQYVP